MNRTVYFKSSLFLFIFLFAVPVGAKLLKPVKNGEEKEILIVNSKRRLYYPIKEEGLTYSVHGPARIEFISRYPVLRKKKDSHNFRYFIVLDDSRSVYPAKTALSGERYNV